MGATIETTEAYYAGCKCQFCKKHIHCAYSQDCHGENLCIAECSAFIPATT